MKIRMQAGGFDEAMKTVEDIEPTLHAVALYLRAHGWPEATADSVSVHLYNLGVDRRNGWPNTYLVMHTGWPVAYSDGSVSPLLETSEKH